MYLANTVALYSRDHKNLYLFMEKYPEKNLILPLWHLGSIG